MDAIFKALADHTRRALLDSLRDKGGQTLTELESELAMTRFGVMKHLKVLEDAKLVVTRKSGRFKHHYLNAVPIQEVADRWMAPYAKPLARYVLDLKNTLEGLRPMADKPDFVLETYIRTTPKALWDAIVNPDKTQLYYYGSRIETTLRREPASLRAVMASRCWTARCWRCWRRGLQPLLSPGGRRSGD